MSSRVHRPELLHARVAPELASSLAILGAVGAFALTGLALQWWRRVLSRISG